MDDTGMVGTGMHPRQEHRLIFVGCPIVSMHRCSLCSRVGQQDKFEIKNIFCTGGTWNENKDKKNSVWYDLSQYNSGVFRLVVDGNYRQKVWAAYEATRQLAL